MLSLHEIASAKSDRTLFEGLSISLLPGSLCQLRGQNGSGKTTLLRILAGLEMPEMGQVQWSGAPIAGSAEFQNALLYLGHRSALKPDLTVEENIAFWAECYDTAMLTEAALKYFGLDAMRDMPCGRLSAGWQRKAALARLVAVPAKLWLLDEPFTHLDPQTTELLYTLIASRCNQGGIVVMAAHAESQIKPTQMLFLKDFEATRAKAMQTGSPTESPLQTDRPC